LICPGQCDSGMLFRRRSTQSADKLWRQCRRLLLGLLQSKQAQDVGKTAPYCIPWLAKAARCRSGQHGGTEKQPNGIPAMQFFFIM
jgi:hypothetical protein